MSLAARRELATKLQPFAPLFTSSVGSAFVVHLQNQQQALVPSHLMVTRRATATHCVLLTEVPWVWPAYYLTLPMQQDLAH